MKNAVVIGFDEPHTFAAGTIMFDIAKHGNGAFDDVVLISKNFAKEDIDAFTRILPCKFVEYQCKVKFSQDNPPFVINRFTDLVFSKFECLRLLSEFDNVIWLDYDQVIIADIATLVEPAPGGLKVLPGGCSIREQLLADIDGYDTSREGICGSTIVFQKNVGDHEALYDFCIASTTQYIEKLYLGEQGIFDLMIQKFGINCMFLDPQIYTPHPTASHIANAKILHSYGFPKFWNGLKNSQWDANYGRWLAVGGQPMREQVGHP